MPQRRDLNLNQPALIPIAGNFDRKPRSLDRDVTTLGRARGADLCLEAGEISTLHCVVYRTSDGFRIRDCNSRCGTRVNGEGVKNAPLHNGDIVNVGPFSFEFRDSAELFRRDKLDPVRIEHWRQSRLRLAKRALKMRKRLAKGGGTSAAEQEWAQKAHLLKDKIRCYDQRLSELEGAEEELTAERIQLEKEAEGQRQRIQKIEGELAQRLAQADEEIRKRWQEFQQRCQAEEARSAATVSHRSATPDEALAQLRQETDDLARHLHGLEDQLTRQQDQLQREQQEFTAMKDQWVKAQTKSSVALEEQNTALADQENALRAQKAELMRMMGEVKKLQEDLRKQGRADVKAIQDELHDLRRENADLRQALDQKGDANASPDVHRQIDDLRAEVQLLNEELQNKELALQELQQRPPTGSDTDVSPLAEENAHLRKQVEELTRKHGHAPKNAGDLDRYEAELNDFQRQLEGDRNKLNNEVESLRERNKELDEAVREMEMELSKERAELARERMRLERVREEVKADMERLQRELSVRDSMAPVQKLREELTGKQPNGSSKPINDRLRTMRTQLNDG